MSKNEKVSGESVKNVFVKNQKLKNVDAVNHFEKEDVARRTIYNNLNKLANEGTIHDKNILADHRRGARKNSQY